MEYAGYIEQYSDKIRYMHMAMLAQLPTGTFVSVWQASPIVLDDLQVHGRATLILMYPTPQDAGFDVNHEISA